MTETASTGQTVILVQPANPQVVYVPVYNTQVVYVQQAPPPSSSNAAAAAVVGFTAGIIIGSSSNNYYHGPYAWRGGACGVQPGVRAAGRLRGRSPGLRGGPPGQRPGQPGAAPGRRRRTTSRSANRPGKPISRHGSPLRTTNQSTRQIHRADEPVDTTDHRQHRERWKRRDGAGESGQPAVHRRRRISPAGSPRGRRISPAGSPPRRAAVATRAAQARGPRVREEAPAAAEAAEAAAGGKSRIAVLSELVIVEYGEKPHETP